MTVANQLHEIIAAQFKIPVESVRQDMDFYSDLQADVLDLPELAMEVEEIFDIMLDDNSVDALRTVRDLQDYVERSLEEKRIAAASVTAAAAYVLAARSRCDAASPSAARFGGSRNE